MYLIFSPSASYCVRIESRRTRSCVRAVSSSGVAFRAFLCASTSGVIAASSFSAICSRLSVFHSSSCAFFNSVCCFSARAALRRAISFRVLLSPQAVNMIAVNTAQIIFFNVQSSMFNVQPSKFYSSPSFFPLISSSTSGRSLYVWRC